MDSTSSIVSSTSQASSNTTSFLESLTIASEFEVISLKQALSGGSSFVVVSGAATETSAFGYLSSNAENGSNLTQAVHYEGKIYRNVTEGAFGAAMLIKQLERQLNSGDNNASARLASAVQMKVIQAVKALWTSSLKSERWRVIRQMWQEIGTTVQSCNDVTPDRKSRLNIIDKNVILLQVADYLTERVGVAITKVDSRFFTLGSEAGSVSLEIARAACGNLGQYTPCQLAATLADLLRDRCQLDVDNTELFEIVHR